MPGYADYMLLHAPYESTGLLANLGYLLARVPAAVTNGLFKAKGSLSRSANSLPRAELFVLERVLS